MSDQQDQEDRSWREQVREALDPKYGAPPPPISVAGFGEVLRRASSRALRTGSFFFSRQHNFFVEATRSALVDPNTGSIRAVQEVAGQIRRRHRLLEAEDAEVYGDIRQPILDGWCQGARQTWMMAVGMVFAGLVLLDLAAAYGGQWSRTNSYLACIGLLGFGTVTLFRSARDHEVMRTRKTLSVRAFMRRLSEIWCPYGKDTKARHFINLALGPVAVALVLGFPAGLMVRLLP